MRDLDDLRLWTGMTNHTTSTFRTAGGLLAGLTVVAAGFLGAPGEAHAGDYDLWRTNFGTTAATVSDDGGAAPIGDLADWQANYGATSASTDSGTGDSDGADFVVWRRGEG